MTALATNNGITIESNFGSIMPEQYPLSDPRAYEFLTFNFVSPTDKISNYWIETIPITGQITDFQPKNILGDDRIFGITSGGQFSGKIPSFTVAIVPDNISEGDETFMIFVYKDVLDPTYGIAPLVKAVFTIADDDEPGFAQHIIGTDDVDKLQGGAKADILKGFGGKDTLTGLGGNDRLVGGAGNDLMYGGDGNDTYIVDSRADRVFELTSPGSVDVSGGIDTVQSSVTYSIADTFRGRQSIERLTLTGTGNISGTGNALANAITGNDGNNVLRGLAGNDTLRGGAGNDKLYGGDGNDTLIGGAGKDAFIFDTASASQDLIADFSHAKGDWLQLSKAVFAAFAYTGTLHSDDFWAAAGATEAHDATDHLIYNTTTGILYYDADGIGGTAAVAVAQLGSNTHPVLVYSDLQIIA